MSLSSPTKRGFGFFPSNKLEMMMRNRLPRSTLFKSRPIWLRFSSSTASMITEKETIKKLLYNIGSRKEVEQYLRMFSSVESHQFAIIKAKIKLRLGWWCCIDGRFEYFGVGLDFFATGWVVPNCSARSWASA